MPFQGTKQKRWPSWALPLVLVLPRLADANPFMIEVFDTAFARTYPWQLCRGTEGLGIGDQVFAIDREITTCKNEGADEYWFATPTAPADTGLRDGYFDPVERLELVNLGGPPGTDPPSPKIYMEEEAGAPLTMEVKRYKNWPMEFKVKRNGEILTFDRERLLVQGSDTDLEPGDRFVNYAALHHNRKLRRQAALRLSYRITQGLGGTITKEYPAIALVVSDGGVWEELVPLTDEQRQQYIGTVLTSQEPRRLEEVDFQNQKYSKVGTGISQQRGSGLFNTFGNFASKIGSVFSRSGNRNTPQPQDRFEERKEGDEEEVIPVVRNNLDDMQVSRFVSGRIPVNLNYFPGEPQPREQQQQQEREEE
ncbi:hypothetical protein ABW21_db0209551 [Orbilia brochopaga]|nr:hypothetical protein ABW21_db0209551 [Drechslerella brochopaga]